MIDLTEVEVKALLKLRSGELFQPKHQYGVPTAGQADCMIRAEILRAVILGLPLLPAEQGQRLTPPPAIRLRDVEIVGDGVSEAKPGKMQLPIIDLRSLKGTDGAAACALILHHCRLSDRLLVSHSHFTQISLKHSRFVEFVGKQMVVEGQVNFSDTASAGPRPSEGTSRSGSTSKGFCSVNLRGALIKGNVKASRARFRCPPYDQDRAHSLIHIPYAFSLAAAEVHGSLILQPSFEAIGGVGASDATINGNVWLQGATLEASDGTVLEAALDMLQARVSLGVVLSAWFAPDASDKSDDEHTGERTNKEKKLGITPFKARGTILLYSAHIGGELYMPGAQLHAFPGKPAINATNARIGKRVRASAQQDTFREESQAALFSSQGLIDFSFAEIGGFEATGAAFDWHPGDARTTNSEPGAEYKKGRQTSAEKAKPKKQPKEHVALDFTEAQIHGDLLIQPYPADEKPGDDARIPTSYKGTVSVADAIIDGRVAIRGVEFLGEHDLAERYALDFSNAQVARSFDLVSQCNLGQGGICFRDAEIGGDLSIIDSRLGTGKGNAIEAAGVSVAGTLALEAIACRGHWAFYAARVGRDVRIEKMSSYDGCVTLTHSTVAGSVEVIDCKLSLPVTARFMKVGGSVSLGMYSGAPECAFDAEGIEIAGNLTIDAKACGAISFALAKVLGLTRIEAMTFVLGAGSKPELSFTRSSLQGGLELSATSVTVVPSLDLDTLQNAFVFKPCQKDWPRAWAIVEVSAISRMVSKPRKEGGNVIGKAVLFWNWERNFVVPIPPHRVGESLKLYNEKHRSPNRIADKSLQILARDSDKSDAAERNETVAATPPIHERCPSGEGMLWLAAELPSNRLPRAGAADLARTGGNWAESYGVSTKDLSGLLSEYYSGCVASVRLGAAHAAFVEDRSEKDWDSHVFLGLTGFTYDQIDRVQLAKRLALSKRTEPKFWLVIAYLRQWGARLLSKQVPVDRLQMDEGNRSDQFGGGPRSGDSNDGPFAQIKAAAKFCVDQVTRFLQGGRLSTPARRRLRWLGRQFEDGRPRQSEEFDPQPHAHLARVYRAVGRSDDAREITYDKLCLEARLSMRQDYRDPRLWTALVLLGIFMCALTIYGWSSAPMALSVVVLASGARWLLYAGFRFGFGFGLYWVRAFITFALCIAVGWVAVEMANRGEIGPKSFATWAPVMELDVVAVNDTFVQDESESYLTFVVPPSPATNPTSKIPCGAAIEPALYAADVFVPLIDLRQEYRCNPGGDYGGWQLAKALYEFLGWIVTSLAILTATGVLRSRSEN